MKRKHRGISLLEVLLAMAMLFGSLTVLSQLAFVGRRHLSRADEVATATRLCQNKLREVLAGIQPLESVDDEPIEEDLDWNYSIDVAPIDRLPLTQVEVQVYRPTEDGGDSSSRPNPFRLVRWMYRQAETPVLDATSPDSTESDLYDFNSQEIQ